MTQNKQHPDCNVTAGFLVSGNSRICVQWVGSMLEKCSPLHQCLRMYLMRRSESRGGSGDWKKAGCVKSD